MEAAALRELKDLPRVDIVSCGRCRHDHKGLVARPYHNDPPWTNYAICPYTGQPILLRFERKA